MAIARAVGQREEREPDDPVLRRLREREVHRLRGLAGHCLDFDSHGPPPFTRMVNAATACPGHDAQSVDAGRPLARTPASRERILARLSLPWSRGAGRCILAGKTRAMLGSQTRLSEGGH